MISPRDSHPAYHCLRCYNCFLVPRRSLSVPQCPRCYDRGLFFGSNESFLRICASAARMALPIEVGAMVARVLKNRCN